MWRGAVLGPNLEILPNIFQTSSFTLLYAMDEISEPELSLKILGHQWFWSYEISDFNSCQKNEQSLKYVCYMLVLDGLPKNKHGYFRLLETNKRVICFNQRGANFMSSANPTESVFALSQTTSCILLNIKIPSRYS